jgi:uncharacterized surface protein with fasciclin (FAS1) repeats
MHKRRLIVTLGAATVLAVPAAGLSSAGARTTGAPTPAGQNQDLVQTAAGAGSFTTLTALVKQAGLAGTLQGKGPYTVFAPTDKAFAKVPKSTLAALAKDPAMLRSVLLYHVAKGRLTASKVVKRTSIRTLDGRSLKVRVRGGKVYVGGARVIKPNVQASNGVIHVINRVLIPSG